VVELLRTGHAYGALTRWRTLHEPSVVSSILGEGDDGLANRFLVHAAAEAYKDALLHEEHRERTGREPFPPEELAELKEIHDAAVQEYGQRFAKAWMWAEPLTAPDRPEFWRLEKLAELDHLRPDFWTSSHLLPGGARGADLGRLEYGGDEVFLAGPSNDGLFLPGHGAAISLVQMTVALILHGREFEYGSEVLASLQALLVLCDETGEAFTRAEEMLDGLKLDFDRAEAGGVGAKIVNKLRRSARRARWRVLRRSRELRPRWLAVRAGRRRRSRVGEEERDSAWRWSRRRCPWVGVPPDPVAEAFGGDNAAPRNGRSCAYGPSRLAQWELTPAPTCRSSRLVCAYRSEPAVGTVAVPRSWGSGMSGRPVCDVAGRRHCRRSAHYVTTPTPDYPRGALQHAA